jgi:hypothetical protein
MLRTFFNTLLINKKHILKNFPKYLLFNYIISKAIGMKYIMWRNLNNKDNLYRIPRIH